LAFIEKLSELIRNLKSAGTFIMFVMNCRPKSAFQIKDTKHESEAEADNPF